MLKTEIVESFKKFSYGNGFGIGGFASDSMHDEVCQALQILDESPITKVQLNQLLVLSHAGSISDGFFKYYWKKKPEHPFDVTKVEFFHDSWIAGEDQLIVSIDHLKWGLYRLYVDGLLFFGNVDAGFNALRSKSFDELQEFFTGKRFDTMAISARGPSLQLKQIKKDDRYLISEMACKTFGELPEDANEAREQLLEEFERLQRDGSAKITFRVLLESLSQSKSKSQEQLLLSFDDVLGSELGDRSALEKDFDSVLKKFLEARKDAIVNTSLYLSMVNDLDVYVATSMRTRQNFRDMASACDQIFHDPKLKNLHLRYFDPTMSAAKGHEDKGLIECLMVRCAKVLVYCEGEKESYGKDAEAAMALSLGKPVIFYCDHGKKTNFYRDVHPLARLIDFRTGVAVGAIVTANVDDVTELLARIFENRMEYRIEHHMKRPGYLKLVEKLTESVVRLQTDDELLTTTFWNHYRNRRRSYDSVATGKEVERT